jgi:polyisoprenoid-binding protein YceI
MTPRSSRLRPGWAPVFGLLVLLAWMAPARAGDLYRIGPDFGSIGFSVGNGWLFSARGSFDRFHGQLVLDLADPGATRIAVTVEAGSVAMGWKAATDMARSPAYFDAARYPLIRFSSQHVTQIAPAAYRIDGTVEIRGIARPQTLLARLVRLDRRQGRSGGVAEFLVTGTIHRSSFGMRADELLVGDIVRLAIRARILLQGGMRG